jgi:nucleoside-diphosphate-sugar epimerase
MKRIVVTGSKGGTGASIVRGLREAGFEVLGVDVKPAEPGEADYVQLNLADAAGVNDVFAGADGVGHFGSRPGDDGMTTTEAFNQMMTAGFNVFQAAKNVGIRRVAWASSIEVYGSRLKHHRRLPVTEESPLAPPGIYASCKLMLESLARDYARWHGMAIAGFRLSRIIYDNDFGRAKLRRFVEDEGLGHDCLWSYVDARDVGTACLAWLKSDRGGAEVFNLAAENIHVEGQMSRLLDRHGYKDSEVTELKGEDRTLFSTDKVRRTLNWKAVHDWRAILR